MERQCPTTRGEKLLNYNAESKLQTYYYCATLPQMRMPCFYFHEFITIFHKSDFIEFWFQNSEPLHASLWCQKGINIFFLISWKHFIISENSFLCTIVHLKAWKCLKGMLMMRLLIEIRFEGATAHQMSFKYIKNIEWVQYFGMLVFEYDIICLAFNFQLVSAGKLEYPNDRWKVLRRNKLRKVFLKLLLYIYV